MKLGVFGGEFDPPHLGHLSVIRTARDQLGLDRLLVVPTGRPPHRSASETPAETRLRMAELAFSREPRVEVSRIELDRGGPSYMVDTLRGLARLGDLFLIIGADQLAVFDRWHESQAIRRLATLVVAPRSPQTIAGGRHRGAGHAAGRPVVDGCARTAGGRPRRRWAGAVGAAADRPRAAVRQCPVLGWRRGCWS